MAHRGDVEAGTGRRSRSTPSVSGGGDRGGIRDSVLGRSAMKRAVGRQTQEKAFKRASTIVSLLGLPSPAMARGIARRAGPAITKGIEALTGTKGSAPRQAPPSTLEGSGGKRKRTRGRGRQRGRLLLSMLR